jgi:hypothetical protein
MDCKISDETRERIAKAWPDILAGLASGDLVRDVLAANLVTRGQVRAFLAGDVEMRAQWDEAREASADAYHDEALSVARTKSHVATDESGRPLYDAKGQPLIIQADAALARNHVDTLKWAARIRNPRLYGDKAQLDVNVRSVDLTKIISDAQARLEASRIVGNAALLGAIEGQARRVLENEPLQLIDIM